ncbi:hypothetical protein [Alteromonas facilis]|uniref:hypothetical protein n=1 Tax=Alteromonas facilis TaxID=2048004 RepID=UPI000C28D4DD|nr:hypothetical protein [Alteromonas facilis]
MRKLLVKFDKVSVNIALKNGFELFESEGSYLLYSFLPLGIDISQLMVDLSNSNYDFNEIAHGHYTLIYIEFNDESPCIRIVQDRFGSEVVFFKLESDELTVATSWLEEGLVSNDEMFNSEVLIDISLTRLNDPKSRFFNLNGSWQELLFGHAVEMKGGSVEYVQTPKLDFFIRKIALD